MWRAHRRRPARSSYRRREVAASVLLGLAVGGALLVGSRSGYTDPAGRVAVSIILVALPSIPAPSAVAVRTLLARTVAVVLAPSLVVLVSGEPAAVAVGIVLAAALGFTVPVIGATAALALLLSGLRLESAPGAVADSGLWELVGASVVVLATLVTRVGSTPGAHPAPVAATEASWTARRIASVAAAVLLAGLSPLGVYGGHWLITAVLLSVRPTPSATRVRLTQRLLGNTVAALLVAALMASGAGAGALAVIVASLTALALALRPLSYLWWAMTAPPVLLIVGDYPAAHDWYEGMVRVGLNVVGAVIVLAVCLLPWARPGPRAAAA